MTDLFWPGAERAGGHLSNPALLHAMVAVEAAWLDTLVDAGIAPSSAAADLGALVSDDDASLVAAAAEATGNPVVPLVALLRERLAGPAPDAARWLHRGLTSQDVLDTALMIGARDAVSAVADELRGQIRALVDLVEAHRGTPMVARTLTQHAVPTTFGLKAGHWLTGVLDAYDDLSALVFPVQVGGAAGTMAAAVELADAAAAPVPAVMELSVGLAGRLGLTASAPWHTTRTPVTRLGDAAVRCTDAWGRIANDVLTLSRPEIGELAEGAGGGSSTMPHKANPVLSLLVRRAALATPQLAATLHLAAAESVDERADGGWHAEWATLRDPAAAHARGRLADQRTARRAQGAHRPDGHPAGAGARRRTRRAAGDGRPRRYARRRRLPRRRRRLSRGAARAGRRSPGRGVVMTVTVVRLGPAQGLPLLVLGPSLGTSAETLWGPAAGTWPTRSTSSAGTCRATAPTPTPAPVSSSSSTSLPTCSPPSTGSAPGRSSTPATRSAAPSGCSCCSTPRIG